MQCCSSFPRTLLEPFPEASSAGSWGGQGPGQGCSLLLFDPKSRLGPAAPMSWGSALADVLLLWFCLFVLDCVVFLARNLGSSLGSSLESWPGLPLHLAAARCWGLSSKPNPNTGKWG